MSVVVTELGRKIWGLTGERERVRELGRKVWGLNRGGGEREPNKLAVTELRRKK